MTEAKDEPRLGENESRRSVPINMDEDFDPKKMAGKTILITGGSTGFGAAFAQEWASHGANIVIGDINDGEGEALVARLRRETGSEHHHYRNCDVTDWDSQVRLFRDAVQLSPTGGIDAVVPCAGIGDDTDGGTSPMNHYENPSDMDRDHPPPPRTRIMDINYTGVMYTVHLALFWLDKNERYLPESQLEHDEKGARRIRDRHILIIGSIASIFPLIGSPQYTASKHALTGLFRAVRGRSMMKGIRVNMICPTFVDTKMVSNFVLFFLAGGGLADMKDVVRAGSRFMADRKVFGRAVIVGPRMKVEDLDDGEMRVVEVPRDGDDEEGKGIWECYLHDYDAVEGLVYRYSRMLVGFAKMRGWYGWLKDIMWISFSRGKEQAKKEEAKKAE